MIEKNPKFLVNDDCAICTLIPAKPISLEVYSEYPTLGRLWLRDQR